MKKLFSVTLVIIMMFAFCACGNNDTAKKKSESSEKYSASDMTVACLKGPTGIGMAKLMDDSESGKTANNYTFTVAASADEISGKIVTGEINIASVPTNLAAKLYSKTGGKIKMLAVNTLGVLSIIENGNTIKTLKDLKGKTVYSIGQGSNPEYILRHILKKNKLEKDVNIQFVNTNDELIAALVSGKAEVAMVAEPAATTVLSKKETLRRVLSINDEWDKLSEGKLMMGCIVALSSYVSENKDAVDKFLNEYESSINFAIKSTDSAASLCQKYEIIPSAEIAKKSISNCNLVFTIGKGSKKEIEGYFKMLKEYSAEAIGEKLPGDDFYYEK